MRREALPSPNGLPALAIPSYSARSSSSLSQESMMAASAVPTNRAVPASIASGLSVVSRITSVGFPKNGASSCIPPESVRMRYARSIRCTNCS